ncbi:unnamed protein product, partial [Staurois parvus]
YCVSCDWLHLVTWYKAVVNSLVPCDLFDHSQISHVVSNDVRSDILLTTLHVIGTSYRGHRIAVLHTPRERAQAGSGSHLQSGPHPCTAPIQPFIYMGRTGSG